MDGATVEALTALARRVGRDRPAVKRSAHGAKRAERYPDKLEERAVVLAARVLAPDLHGIVGQINQSKDFGELRKKLIAYYSEKMSPDKLAELVHKTQVLAHLSGRYTAQKQTE
jgi:hypothetical protein